MTIEDSYDQVTVKLNANIKVLKAHSSILDDNKYAYLFPVYEKSMYIALAASDLNIALKHLELSSQRNNGIEQNYFARVVSLTSYELLNNRHVLMAI